ncbi:hypothetical protein V2G26_002191 [Clonostachys chloroleuca]
MDFGDASEDLLRAALVNRTSDLAILIIHRLVQSVAQKTLTELEIIKYFDAAIHLLYYVGDFRITRRLVLGIR